MYTGGVSMCHSRFRQGKCGGRSSNEMKILTAQTGGSSTREHGGVTVVREGGAAHAMHTPSPNNDSWTERLRRQGARQASQPDDSGFVGLSNPLEDLSHMLGGCPGTPNRFNALQDLAFAIQELGGSVPAHSVDTQEFRTLTNVKPAAH